MVRTDLPLPQQLVQAAHAAFEAGLQGLQVPNLVLCSAQNEQELFKQIDYLMRHNVSHIVFREPDIGNEVTAIAALPIDRKCLKHWQLWRN